MRIIPAVSGLLMASNWLSDGSRAADLMFPAGAWEVARPAPGPM
jgi:hypothetical protein